MRTGQFGSNRVSYNPFRPLKWSYICDFTMSGKLFIKTFGCQMNEYDSSKMAEVLRASHGLELTSDPAAADVLLFNTCSVREKAQEKVFSELGRWRWLKQQNPRMVMGVGGCVASQEGQEIRRRAPFVDLVFGPQTLHRLPQMLDDVRLRSRPVVDVSFPEIEKFDHLPAPTADGPSAFVSIMEGCSKYCSFCVVPYTRGEEISRPFDDVLAEIVSLAKQGVREVTLLGQNVNAYRGAMSDGSEADLALLLHYISAIDSIGRIRYTTSHPLEMSPNLIAAYQDLPKVVSHLHLPVQSGCDRILAQMKRGYDTDSYIQTIQALRKARPGISITSDFIIGFPGESDLDFAATMKLIDTVGFDQSFSFIYSPRPGTPAAMLADDVSMQIKKQRLAVLQERINRSSMEISTTMVGSNQVILVQGEARFGANLLTGRTENNRSVNFVGPRSLIGEFIEVKITEVLPNSLKGELLSMTPDLAKLG